MGRPARRAPVSPVSEQAESKALEQLAHLERWTCGPRPLVSGVANHSELARAYRTELSRLEAAGLGAVDRLEAIRDWCSASQRAARQHPAPPSLTITSEEIDHDA